jgi:ABC-2 type transport system permease protein
LKAKKNKERIQMKSLTSVIIKNSKRQEKQNTVKEKVLSFIAFAIVFGFLAISMTVLSFTVTKKLKEIDQSYTFINILVLMNFFILFAKSIFESLNVLYFSKDLKHLLRMPIKSKDIINAKFINMILSEYQMEFIMLAIPMIVYGIIMKVEITFYLYTVLVLLILPIIPIVTTSIVVAIIMRFSNHLKNKTQVLYITIIISAILIDLIFTGFKPIKVTKQEFEAAVLKPNGLATMIADKIELIKPIMNTLLNYNNENGIKNLSIYIVESIVMYILGILVISKIYLKGVIGTTINSKKIKGDTTKLTIEDFKKQNKIKSYVQKERKTISRTPIFCIQCLMIPIIYPLIILEVFIVAVIVSKKLGIDIIQNFLGIINTSIGQAIFIGVGLVFFMMNFCSIIGISKDCKTAILTKTLPIKLEKQFNIKTSIGKRINMLSVIIITFSYWYAVKNLAPTIIMFTILYLLNSIGEKIKLLIDIRKPQINWDNEYTMMKQNTNIMNVLFYTLSILIALYIISKIIPQAHYYLATILGIVIASYFIITNYISKKQNKIFDKVY